jgi:hypothetical protein
VAKLTTPEELHADVEDDDFAARLAALCPKLKFGNKPTPDDVFIF